MKPRSAHGLWPLRMGWTLAEIADFTRGSIVRGDPRMHIGGVATDSRALRAGELFFALRGSRCDGHRFAQEAVDRGGCGVVVADDTRPQSGVVIRVRNTERALGDLAAHTRRRGGFKVFALTGSNGKTTTKEMVAAICCHRWPGNVLKTEGNRNNLIGLPLTLLGWQGEAVAVLEMGMNREGEISRLTSIAAPDVGAVLNVGAAHLEGLGSIAAVAVAKGELFAALRDSAVAVINSDDPLVVRAARKFPGQKVYFGAQRSIRAEHVVDFGLDGVGFELHCGPQAGRVRLRPPGLHNVANAVAAAAIAAAGGIDFDHIAAGLEAVRPLPMRMEVRRLRNQVTLINDAYNANPGSMEAALRALASLPGRSLAVLGEMRELGMGSEDAHHRVGERAFSLGLDFLVVVGMVAAAVASGAHAAGMRAASIAVCESREEAARVIIEQWRPGDVVLVKGSRAAGLEAVAAMLEDAGNRP